MYVLSVYISIHPMLLFIAKKTLMSYEDDNFNTSHVTVYPKYTFSPRDYQANFNTSHVTVYLVPKATYEPVGPISIHPMLLFIMGKREFEKLKPNFNTSHVTVYLHKLVLVVTVAVFQYIPCYCLSTFCCFRTKSLDAFQYIPCYCLSFGNLL